MVVVEDVGLMLLDGELGSLRVLREKVMAWSCVGSEGEYSRDFGLRRKSSDQDLVALGL